MQAELLMAASQLPIFVYTYDSYKTKRNVDPIFDRDPSIERKGKEKKKKKEGKFFPPQTRIRDFRGSFDATPLGASLPVFSRSIAVTDCGNVYKARVTRKGEGTLYARLQ